MLHSRPDWHFTYVLDADRNPVPEPDPLRFARWMDDAAGRTIARTNLARGVEVSTVCLGWNHNLSAGAPILFETWVRGDVVPDRFIRYRTWDEAAAGHAEIVAALIADRKAPR